MPLQMTTLKPGLLISLNTSIRGNTTYERTDIKRANKTDAGQLIDEWNTKRTTADPPEAEAAAKIRSKCSSIIRSVCTHSSRFGLLCPMDKKPAFEIAVEQAEALARAFNTQAKQTIVEVAVFTGYIAPDDSKNVAKIRDEVRNMIETMEAGVLNLDVESIRDAATKAKQIVGILSPEIANTVNLAVNAAREVARRIVKATEIGNAAATVDRNAIRILRASRLSFLDLENDGAPAPTFIPASSARAIELDWNPNIPDTISSREIGL